MSAADKLGNKVEELAGKGKETTGAATGDRDLEAEGKVQGGKASLKQAGEKVKDAFR